MFFLEIFLRSNEAKCPFQVLIGHLHVFLHAVSAQVFTDALVSLSPSYDLIGFFTSSVGKCLGSGMFGRLPLLSFLKNAFRSLGLWLNW